VRAASAGYFSHELGASLYVSVKDARLQLVRQRRLKHQRCGSLYFYTDLDRACHQAQWAARQALLEAHDTGEEKLRAAVVLFNSLLNEQQRRLYAGLESLKLGHGADTLLSQWLGLDVETVAQGRRELPDREVQRERVRRAGGGRPQTEKKRNLESFTPPSLGRHRGGSNERPDIRDRQVTVTDPLSNRSSGRTGREPREATPVNNHDFDT